MAAGKSTVREIIGHDDFWSKVPPHAWTLLVGSKHTVLCMWLPWHCWRICSCDVVPYMCKHGGQLPAGAGVVTCGIEG